jgi:hypothetical protein
VHRLPHCLATLGILLVTGASVAGAQAPADRLSYTFSGCAPVTIVQGIDPSNLVYDTPFCVRGTFTTFPGRIAWWDEPVRLGTLTTDFFYQAPQLAGALFTESYHQVEIGGIPPFGLGSGGPIFVSLDPNYRHTPGSITIPMSYWVAYTDWDGIHRGAQTSRVGATLTATVLPEPGTWALLGTGLLGVLGVGRRKRKA